MRVSDRGVLNRRFMDMTDRIIAKYYGDNPELKELLILHSSCVARRAMMVLDSHPEIVCDRSLVYDGAMLHDIGIVMTDAPGIHCHGSHPYICHGILGAGILLAEAELDVERRDYYEALARIASRHTGTGLSPAIIKRQNLPLPLDVELCPRSIEEQIVCYADKFYSKSHPEREKSPEQVRRMLQNFPDADIDTWDRWQAMFG